jgi:hypothetical protein
LRGLMKGTVAPAAPFRAFDDIETAEIGCQRVALAAGGMGGRARREI